MSSEILVDNATVARLRDLARDVAVPGEDVLGDLLATYTEDLQKRLASLVTEIAQSDLMAAAETAHALKGASLTVGAAGLAAHMMALEQALRAGMGYQQLAAACPGLAERSLEALREALTRAR